VGRLNLQGDAKGRMPVLKRMHTYTIIRGRVLKGRLLLLSKIVLKHKYNAKGEVIRKKVRLCI